MGLPILGVLLAADPALLALDRQIAADPKAVEPRIAAAERRLESGDDLGRALWDAEIVVALVPEDARAHVLYGLLLEERAEASRARAAYQTALVLDAKNPVARFRLAGLLFHDGAFADAAAAYGLYLKAHPEATGARLQYAVAMERSGDAAGAERELKALYADPRTQKAAGARLAELYVRQGRERDAARVRAAVDPPKRKLRDLQPSAR